MSIRPQAEPGEPPLRWNWDTPLFLSPYDPKILYAAGNKLFRSSNRGLTWEGVSPDLTSNARREDIVTMGVKGSDIRIAKDDGIQAWPTIVSFAESSKRAGILYAGTDDGNVQVSRDTGRSWANVTDRIPGLPKGVWVSEVVPSRFDEGTVYATFDAHRQDDFGPYIYVSHDYGQTWQTAVGNLRGEVVKTLTEDIRNPDVLYIGTETGLFVSIDRAKSWTRIKANLPTVRIDEVTLHPRDNAMIVATHGRAIWILDHLEAIQEYAATQAVSTDAKLFTPAPSAMYRRPARDRNYEFWGDQTFFGENPPRAAVISWLNKRQVGEVKLKITDTAGREVREISGPLLAGSSKPGIQSACWDLRVQPVPVPPQEGRGRGQNQAQNPNQGQNQNQQPSPFGAGCPAPAGPGGGGFGFAGPAAAGPYLIGGVYSVALIVDGKTVDTKPLRVTDDPEVVLTSAERRRQYDMAMEMHALQPRLIEAATAHVSLTRQINELTTTAGDRNDIPADVKAALDSLKSDLAGLAPKLTQPSGRGGGGGRGGVTESLVAKLGQAKNGLMGGMVVGEQATRAYTEVRTQVPKVITDVNVVIGKAVTLSGTLARYNLTLTVPPPVKAPEGALPRRTSSAQR
jgi:hypothetical protein